VLLRGQPPPPIRAFLHKRKFRSGGIGELVQIFDAQPGANERIQHFAKTMIPDVKGRHVALVIGANDVVNPVARHDKDSPIYGMPILNVDKARSIIVMKRSMNPGFAGIENELFYDQKTAMLFGDAKASLTKLVTEIKAL